MTVATTVVEQLAVLDCLDTIVDPCSAASVAPMGLVSMGLVRQVRISPTGEVDVDLRLTSPSCFMIAYLSTESVKRVGALPGVSAVRVHPDEGLDWSPELINAASTEHRRQGLVLMRRPPANLPS